MDLDAFAWLLTAPGQALLARAHELSGEDPLRAQTVLRKEAEPAYAALALSQVDLRGRAVAKFGPLAASMYFTPDGLEQATRLAVAEHRAARLVAFEAASVIDLGCGIGGDLIASARAGLTAAGVDLDPERVAIAAANLEALGLPGAVTRADATTVDHAGFAVAFADPARRRNNTGSASGQGRGRAQATDGWTPPWDWVSSLFERDACVKVAPGIDHDLIAASVEGEWVSDHGDVKEAALWSGALATVRRRATVIGRGGLATLTDEDDPLAVDDLAGRAGLVRPVGEFLYEPDGAVIRAGLVSAVVAGVNGGLVDEHIAYVTSEAPFVTPFATAYRVLEELPYREKQLRAALRERGVGRLTIKKRGVAIVPETLRRSLALRGSAEATIVMTRIAGEGRCLLVEPLAG